MPLIKFIEFGGTEHQVDIPIGWSLMKGAVHHGIPGILAECGGACVCATCLVHIAPDWRDRLLPMTEVERDTLEFAPEVSNDSRLACQVSVAQDLDGLIVRLPKSQVG